MTHIAPGVRLGGAVRIGAGVLIGIGAVVLPGLDRALDAASIRASALVAAREALLAGTTTLIDHHASPNAIDGSLPRHLTIADLSAHDMPLTWQSQRTRLGMAG